MGKSAAIALTGLAAFAAAQAPPALGQAGLDRRLAAAKRLECAFPVLGTGTWNQNVPAIGVITASLILATLIYAPFAPFLWPTEFTAAAVGSVVGLGVLCTAAAFMVFFALIAEVGPARATVITYVNPAVAIILGALVLSEPLTTGMMIGFPLVILGSYLGTTRSPPAAPNAVSQPSS